MTRVTVDHVRALCAGARGLTVLVLSPAGPRVVTPDAALKGIFAGIYLEVLCTRSELIDSGLRVGRDGQLVGPTVEICAQVADYWSRVLG